MATKAIPPAVWELAVQHCGEHLTIADIKKNDLTTVVNAAATFNNACRRRIRKKTGVESLAISIGTSHGAFKFRPGQKPQLRFDILEEVGRRLPYFPIVLHGASSIPKEFSDKIKRFGGKIDDAVGVPEEMLRKAARYAVCKINIDSDIRMAFTAAVREHLWKYPDNFDPRQYLAVARQTVKGMVAHKIRNVLDCEEKA